MRVAIHSVDGHNYPNLALMRISAWHKAKGDSVEWFAPLESYDRVYASKVFTLTPKSKNNNKSKEPKTMKLLLITISAIIGVALICVCCVFSSKNAAISLEESVNAAKSGINVQLSNRFNKLTELAECVKKYDAHEYKTLLDVITARGKNMSAKEAKQCIAAFSRVEERYPDLKSQANYQQLMTEISLAENHLAQTKRAYNEFVRDYNRHVRKFPTSIFLGWTGYEVVKYDYYEANESVRDSKPMKLFD